MSNRDNLMLKSIYVENVATLRGVHLFDFSDGNIISIVGGNNRGKSMVVTALEIIGCDSDPKSQSDLISYDENYMKVGLVGNDGVSVYKTKYRNGGSLWEMYDGDKLIFTNKVSNALVSTDGVPAVIHDWVGLLRDNETGELVNIRRGRDRLFFTHNTGSELYKILNSVLHSEELYRASSLAGKERNKISSDLSTVNTKFMTLLEEYNGIEVYESEYLDSVEELMKILELTNARVDAISSIEAKVKDLSEVDSKPVYAPLDLGALSALQAVHGVAASLAGLGSMPSYDALSSSNVASLVSLWGTASELASLGTRCVYEALDAGVFPSLLGLLRGASELEELDSERGVLAKSIVVSTRNLNEALDELREEGGDVAMCQHCGKPTFICSDVASVV